MRTTLGGWHPLPGDRVKVVMNAGMAAEGRSLAQALAEAAHLLEDQYAAGTVVRSYPLGPRPDVIRYEVRYPHGISLPDTSWCVLVEAALPAAQLALW